MPRSTYEQVRDAAVRLDRQDTGGQWGLADAVLAHVPALPEGNPNYPSEGVVATVPVRLAELAAMLTGDGVTTPKGDPYSPGHLFNLRETAMAWAPEDRHVEAAWRTHVEASNDFKRGLLVKLCAVSRGESVRRPSGIEVDDWQRAVERVRSRTSGYAVAANDLRIALSRPTNNTGPTRTPRPEDVGAAVREHGAGEVVDAMTPQQREEVLDELQVRAADQRFTDTVDEAVGIGEFISAIGLMARAKSVARDGIRKYQAAVASGAAPEDHREQFVAVAEELVALAQLAADVGRGITDEALNALLDSEVES